MVLIHQTQAACIFTVLAGWGSGIEIPAKDQDFYALKDVPHGLVSQKVYFFKVTNAWRRCFVYTPADAASHIEIAKTYTPVDNHHKIYIKYFEIFESLSSKLGDEFAKIAELQ